MEPHGAIILWKRSLDYNLRYVTFIGDGDSKSYQNVCQEKPYGSEYPVEKSDCIGYVQKRMGTALRKIKKIIEAQNCQMVAQLEELGG